MEIEEDDEFPLHRAVFHRDTQRLSDLLEQGEYANLKNKSGNTALHVATSLGYSDSFDLLIEHFADFDLTNELGETALHLAVKKRNVDFVEKLLNCGARCDFKDQERNTPIMLAALCNFEAGIYLLLEKSCIFNSDGDTFIHLLLLKKNTYLLEQVLQYEKSACTKNYVSFYKDKKGRNPLQLAIVLGYQRGFELLLLHNIDDATAEDNVGRTALHLAVQKRNYAMIEQLINLMPELYALDHNGMSAFDLAVVWKIEFVICLCLKKGVDYANGASDESYPIHMAVLKKNKIQLSALLKESFEIDAKDRQGRTPLIWAIIRNFSSGVNMLLRKGADVNVEDTFGNTALHYSVLGKNKCLMETMAAHGADINHRNGFRLTVIHLAVMHNFKAGVKFLIERGADLIDNGGSKGNTPLHLAVLSRRNKKKNMLRTIISQESVLPHHLNHTNYHEESALELALENCLDSTAFFLLQNGASPHSFGEGHLILKLAVCRPKQKLNIQLISKLCEKGAAVNERSYELYETPLHYAALFKHSTAVKALLDNGARVNCRECRGNTALHFALERPGDEEETLLTVDVLIKHGVVINVTNADGKTALHYACSSGFENVFHLLRENGACISMKNNHSILRCALESKVQNKKLVERLLSLGLDPNPNPWVHYGMPPLNWAIYNSFYAAVKLLVEYGADVNSKADDNNHFNHIFINAAGCSDRTILDYIINRVANVSQKCREGTALHIAVKNHLYHNVNLLIRNRINVDEVDETGNTALHVACQGDVFDEDLPRARVSIGIVKLLIAHRANVNLKRRDGSTPLHLASKENGEKIVEVLLNNGAKVNEQDVLGNTALHIAAYRKKEEIVNMMVDSGGDLHLRNINGDNIFYLIVKHQLTSCLNVIKKFSTEVNTKDEKGNTCLHVAVLNQNVDILNMLLSNNADSEIKNQDNLTATFLAASIGFHEGIYYLLEKEIQPDSKVWTAEENLLDAVLRKDSHLMKELLESAVDVNYKKCKSALHLAVLRNFKIGVDALIKAGANVNNADIYGNNSLHMAATVRNAEIIEALLSNGGSVNSLNNDNRSAVHLAALTDYREGIKMLCDRGASLHHKDSDGSTPFLLAMSKKKINVNRTIVKSEIHLRVLQEYKFGVKALMRDPGVELRRILYGKKSFNFDEIKNTTAIRDVLAIEEDDKTEMTHLTSLTDFSRGLEEPLRCGKWIEDYDGNTPFYLAMPTPNCITCSDLHLATLVNYEFGVGTLIKAGASINVKDMHENTPLHLSAIVKNAPITDLLLSAGARLHGKNKDGRTALHLASITNFEAGAEMVIGRGALLDIQDKDGNTPLHLAFTNGNEDLACKLIQNRARMDISNCQNKSFLSLRLEADWPEWNIEKLLVKLKIAIAENVPSVYDPHPGTKGPGPDWWILEKIELETTCKTELVKMESYRFGKNSLVEVLKDHRYPHFIKNDQLKLVINSSTLEEELPNYAPLLKSRFKRLERAYDQLSEACIRFPVLLKSGTGPIINLPTEIRRKILSKLSDDELVSVLDVLRKIELHI